MTLRTLYKLLSICCALGLFQQILNAQIWAYEELAPMPEAVSNNAVVSAEVDGVWQVYSFSGIDETKIWSGIHDKAWKYNTQTDTWSELPPLPDGGGRIAAAASRVKDKIYIIGGYEVFPTGNEASFDQVHIFDPATDSYLENGSPVPVPIDDQVQAVWRDSLIYVITGWSDTGNVPDVQIYDPANDNWQVGTPVPGNTDYEVFGASGTIIGDTIYYAGGARYGVNFPLGQVFRIGYINPADPTNISWSAFEDPLARGYRMACVKEYDRAHWIGGSTTSYNYNGIAYNGTGGVTAEHRIVQYDRLTGQLTETDDQIEAVMDLRSAAELDVSNLIIAGGMEEGQLVSNKTFHLINYNYLGIDGNTSSEQGEEKWQWQNTNSGTHIQLHYHDEDSFRIGENWQYSIIAPNGQILQKGQFTANSTTITLELRPNIQAYKGYLLYLGSGNYRQVLR